MLNDVGGRAWQRMGSVLLNDHTCRNHMGCEHRRIVAQGGAEHRSANHGGVQDDCHVNRNQCSLCCDRIRIPSGHRQSCVFQMQMRVCRWTQFRCRNACLRMCDDRTRMALSRWSPTRFRSVHHTGEHPSGCHKAGDHRSAEWYAAEHMLLRA